MEKYPSPASYLKQNILLLSTGAALCLFLQPVKIVISLEALIFVLTAFVCWLEGPVKSPGSKAALIPAGSFVLVGFLTFSGEWAASTLVAKLAGLVGLNARVLVYLLAALGSLAGSYAFYRLACRFEALIRDFFGGGSSPRSNWLLPITAACFFLVEPEFGRDWLCCVIAAVGVSCLIARHGGNLWQAKGSPTRRQQLFCALTAAGICWFRYGEAAAVWTVAPLVPGLLSLLGVPFVYLCVRGFFRWLQQALEGVFADVTRAEKVFYASVALIFFTAVTAVFLQTDAFYGTAQPYDIIYTSDSHILVEGNAYLALANGENDLRQPLYAVFAAPFVGAAWLVGQLLPASPAMEALALNYPQILILLFSNFLLAKTLGLTGGRRMAFFVLSSLTYPTLLFSFMMEQYIFVYFYLILFVHLYCKGRKDAAALWGAGGTLLTSVVLLPLMTQRHPVKAFRSWFSDMLRQGLTFLLVLVIFGRLEIILDVGSALVDLGQFTGEKLTMAQKLFQYTAFPISCLIAPAAGEAQNIWGVLSWQLDIPAGLSFGGIGLLLIALGSAVLNRKQRDARMAMGWLIFSFALLFGLGWGTQENGLILYALYFGWALWLLLYRLTQWLEEVLRIRHLSLILSILGCVALAAVNLPAMAELIGFAVAHYPL